MVGVFLLIMMNSNIEKRVILPWLVVVVVVISCVSSCVSGFNLVYQRGQQGKRNVGLLKKEEPFIPLSFQGLYMSSSSMNEDELRNQKAESIQSLSDYHDGTWICKDGATSFTISSDTAAGIIQKSTSSPYQTSVNIRFSKGGLKMVETFSWQEQELTTAVTRSVPLIGPSIDVDAVDASYSIDQTLMDLPSTISGTDSIVKFGIEHVLSIQDNVRVRAFCFYGMDDRLSRIVLTNEERQQSLKSLLLQDEDEEMSNNIEQLFSSKKKENQMEKIKQILNNNNNDPDKNNDTLKNHPITLFGLSLGPWLGDSVIRDQSLFHTKQNKSNNNNNNKGGFGSSSKPTNLSKNNNNDESSSSNQPLDGFAEWTLGVQKVAMLYKWDFDETIRQVNELGRSMGPSYCSTLPKSSMGIINEKLMSRRIPKEDRMLYIDYDMGAYAGFTLGSIYLKVPTFLFFSQMDADKLVLPFVTEFAVFQKDTTDDNNNKDDESFDTEDDMNGEIICSKMMRVYDNHGRLKQGITSFYTLKPMATEADKMDP